MKKKIICLACAVLLSLSFCACGQDRSGTRPSNGMEILPETSPMISPDPSDGVVRDQDGIIGNGDGAVASPDVSMRPDVSASPAPGGSAVMPTTVPSASPKP